VTFEGQGLADPEREARRNAREVLWDAWSRYFNLQPSEPNDKETVVALLFADFVIDKIDLARQLLSLFGGGEDRRPPFTILTELEQRAKGWRP
jgi:hypothetical protein